VADIEDLDRVCSQLLPHVVTFDQSSTPSVILDDSPNEHEPINQFEDVQSQALFCVSSIQPPPASPSENPHDYNLFATYTTLEDPVPADVIEPVISFRTVDSRNEEAMRDAEMCGADMSDEEMTTLIYTRPEPHAIGAEDFNSGITPSNDPSNRIIENRSEYETRQSSRLSPSPTPRSNYVQASEDFHGSLPNSMPSAVHSQSYLGTAFTTLTSMYSEYSPDTIVEIIRLGDTFLREDAKAFIESFYFAWSQNALWDRPLLANPYRALKPIERLFNGFRCAEVLEQGSIVDPIRLRVARVLLYHYYEQVRIDLPTDPFLVSRRSRGRDTASIALDKVLEDMYASSNEPTSPKTQKRRRESLQKNKKIGKRWCMLATHLGLGILLVCHPSLEAQMYVVAPYVAQAHHTHSNDTRFTEGKITALITYIINAYPYGIHLCQKLEPLAQSFINGGLPPNPWIDQPLLAALAEYLQSNEKRHHQFRENWRQIELSRSFYLIIHILPIL